MNKKLQKLYAVHLACKIVGHVWKESDGWGAECSSTGMSWNCDTRAEAESVVRDESRQD